MIKTNIIDTTKQNVSLHANNCFKEGELDKKAVVKDFLTTASDGKIVELLMKNSEKIV